MAFFLVFVLLTITLYDANSSKLRFDNHKLIGLRPENFQQLKFLNQLQSNPDFDVWNSIRGLDEEIDVRLSPESYDEYKKIFDLLGIVHRVKNEDIQSAIDYESWQKNSPFSLKKFITITNNSTYLNYQQIIELMNKLSLENSDFVSNYSAGSTHLGQDLMVLKLKTPTSKRSMWLDCGIHAREWITISTCVYIMEKLVASYANKDLDVVRLLDFYEIHIMPVVNPDGYQYSIEVDRMWRKNRSPPNLFGCSGVDLNRNFGFYWLTAGSSNYECSPVYAGKMADSEPETKAVENAIMQKQGQWDSYVSLHSYGQFFFTPWGFTSVLPSDYEDLKEKALIATEGIKSVNGSEFTVGSSSNLLYMSSGGSEDWAKAKAGIKYAYSVELGPKQSSNGFIVPESQIPTAGEEMYQGLLALYTELMNQNITVF